jgi:hypothetical protein
MAPIPIDPDCVWNYYFCELIDLGVEIDEDWYSVGMTYGHEVTFYIFLSVVLLVFVSKFRG